MSLSIVKEFEMDIWLFTNGDKQFFQTSKLHYVETVYWSSIGLKIIILPTYRPYASLFLAQIEVAKHWI